MLYLPTPHIPHATHHFIEADGFRVFYRESGPADAPVVLLLDFPTSSFQYRERIPRLADKFHVTAPDLPGFGFTEVPADYTYTFASLAKRSLLSPCRHFQLCSARRATNPEPRPHQSKLSSARLLC